jgi:hypothetical protein
MYLMEDIIQNINNVIIVLLICNTLTSKSKEAHQCTMNSITVPPTWGNVVPKEKKKMIIQWKETENSTNFTILSIEIIEKILVRAVWTMETMASTKGISKEFSKPVEVGFTWDRVIHPHHSVFFILLEGKSGVKLLNEWNDVIMLEPHKLVQHHLF